MADRRYPAGDNVTEMRLKPATREMYSQKKSATGDVGMSPRGPQEKCDKGEFLEKRARKGGVSTSHSSRSSGNHKTSY